MDLRQKLREERLRKEGGKATPREASDLYHGKMLRETI
jgi:hypothetical protein